MAAYFTPNALKFLRGLGRNNNREWFEERRSVWEKEWKTPMAALIAEVNHALEDFAPEHIRPPHKAMMRIYRDIRFAQDKRPYKTHVATWWGHQALSKTSGAGFYFDVSTTAVTIAAGAFMPLPDQLLAIRRRLVLDHADFRKMLESKRLKALLPNFDGRPLTRPPKGFAGQGLAVDLLRCRRWGVSVTLPVEAALDETLAVRVVQGFRVAAPMVAFLNATLVPMARRPLF